jgi:hypothetical protein
MNHDRMPPHLPSPPEWTQGLWASPRTAADLCGVAPELVEDLVRGGRIRAEERGSRIPVDALWIATREGATR